MKFLTSTGLSLKFIRKNLDEVYDGIRMFRNYDDSIEKVLMMNRLLTRGLQTGIRNCSKISWLKVTKRLMDSSLKSRPHRSVNARLFTKKMP